MLVTKIIIVDPKEENLIIVNSKKGELRKKDFIFQKKDPLMALPWNQVKYNKGGFTLTYADIYQSCPTNTIYKFK